MSQYIRRFRLIAASVTLVSIAALAHPANAQDAAAAYKDIEQTLGSVPSFFKAFPEVGIAGAWAEFKSVQLNPDTALGGKTKEQQYVAMLPCSWFSCVAVPWSCRRAPCPD